jgi:hypothetical protein
MAQQKTDSLEIEKPASIGGALSSFATDTTQKIGEGFGDMGRGIFNDLIGNTSSAETPEQEYERLVKEQTAKPEEPKMRLEGGNLFNFRSIEEDRQIKEIHQMIEQVKVQTEQVKQMNKQMITKIKDIENATINAKANKASVYEMSILKLFSQMLDLHLKDLSKANTWLDAFSSKKAKRGSAFTKRSEKSGTEYSMSQEIATARSIQ